MYRDNNIRKEVLFKDAFNTFYTTAFVTLVVEHSLEQGIAQWILHEGSIRRPITQWADGLPMYGEQQHMTLIISV